MHLEGFGACKILLMRYGAVHWLHNTQAGPKSGCGHRAFGILGYLCAIDGQICKVAAAQKQLKNL